MDPMKIAGVAGWLTPGSKKEVQSFLGFTNFYRRFIQGFSDLARLLFDLTRNNLDWHLEAAEQSAFEAIHKRVVSAPILMFLNDSRPFQVELRFCHWSSFLTVVSIGQHVASGCLLFQESQCSGT
jgi:hypothetical protein